MDDPEHACSSGLRHTCNVHVECDDACLALENPETLDEHRTTLAHYKNHSLHTGCSHGC